MTLEGIVEATGVSFQARTSFLPEEIKWGRRLDIIGVSLCTKNISSYFPLEYFPSSEECAENNPLRRIVRPRMIPPPLRGQIFANYLNFGDTLLLP